MSRKLEKGKGWFTVTLLISQDCFSQDDHLLYPYSYAYSIPIATTYSAPLATACSPPLATAFLPL